MPSFATIAINDGKATPVAHSFDPASNDGSGNRRVSVYADRATGIPVAYPTLTVVTDSTPDLDKVRLSLRLPTLETVNGSTAGGYSPAPKEAFYETATIEFKFSKRGSSISRKDLLAYAKNLLAHATVSTVIVDGQCITG